MASLEFLYIDKSDFPCLSTEILHPGGKCALVVCINWMYPPAKSTDINRPAKFCILWVTPQCRTVSNLS